MGASAELLADIRALDQAGGRGPCRRVQLCQSGRPHTAWSHGGRDGAPRTQPRCVNGLLPHQALQRVKGSNMSGFGFEISLLAAVTLVNVIGVILGVAVSRDWSRAAIAFTLGVVLLFNGAAFLVQVVK